MTRGKTTERPKINGTVIGNEQEWQTSRDGLPWGDYVMAPLILPLAVGYS